MMGWRVLGLAAMMLSAPVQAQSEPPERVRLQKEWLSYLGYFGGQVNTVDTAEYRAARRSFAQDAGLDPENRPLFHDALKRNYDANAAARMYSCAGAASKRAVACDD